MRPNSPACQRLRCIEMTLAMPPGAISTMNRKNEPKYSSHACVMPPITICITVTSMAPMIGP